jgi:hypothetical protein
VVWLDCRIPAEKELLRKFFGDMKAGNAVVLGWYSTERSGVTTASEFGIGTLPADHFTSPSVYAGSDHRIRIPEVPKRPALENKAYVAIFISDGDNLQYAQRAMRRLWDRSAASRGKVALNWTIAPGLVDIGPGILNYYYTTATPHDCFVAGPSGMGYMMPFNTLDEPGAPVGACLTDRRHGRAASVVRQALSQSVRGDDPELQGRSLRRSERGREAGALRQVGDSLRGNLSAHQRIARWRAATLGWKLVAILVLPGGRLERDEA